MKARLLKGSKQEIAEQLIRLDGEVNEALIFIDEPFMPNSQQDIFTEMEPFMVHQPDVDDSRDAIYSRLEGE